MLISISFRIMDVRGSHANLEINASDETISRLEHCFRTLPHSTTVFPNGMKNAPLRLAGGFATRVRRRADSGHGWGRGRGQGRGRGRGRGRRGRHRHRHRHRHPRAGGDPRL
ncbi:hypothetical protein F1735_22250 [Massilia sp. CCM 8694]|uniref:Uncharacterized protein n=1 Tax=Massilia genomosp. 1 TaxID=2609280 RepID=A0ABX0MXI9_9BURK|nr:hypothetical protein [Massilia genomosp. 1]